MAAGAGLPSSIRLKPFLWGLSPIIGPFSRPVHFGAAERFLKRTPSARLSYLAKTTLTSMLDRMEKNGHLRRVFDPSDRRQIRLVLTEKAIAMRDRYQAVSVQMNQIFYRGFSEEEIAQLDQTLGRVLENLKEYEGK